MTFRITPLEWSSCVRGLGVGIMLGGELVSRWEIQPFVTLWLGIALIALGHFHYKGQNPTPNELPKL